MTPHEKELLAQQADAKGWASTARTIRQYLKPGPYSRADLVDVQMFCTAYGWDRLPGWRVIRPTERDLRRRDRRRASV